MPEGEVVMNKKAETRGKYRKDAQRKNGGLFLVLQEHEDTKLVEVWLSREEEKDEALRRRLKELYQNYRSRKFTVAEYHSGTEPVYELTRDLLLYNRKRIAELENRNEKSSENPNLSAGYSGTLPIQC